MRWYEHSSNFLHQLYSEFETRYGRINEITVQISGILINKVSWASPNSVIRTKYILIKEAKTKNPNERFYYGVVINAISNWQKGKREFELI